MVDEYIFLFLKIPISFRVLVDILFSLVIIFHI